MTEFNIQRTSAMASQNPMSLPGWECQRHQVPHSHYSLIQKQKFTEVKGPSNVGLSLV